MHIYHFFQIKNYLVLKQFVAYYVKRFWMREKLNFIGWENLAI